MDNDIVLNESWHVGGTMGDPDISLPGGATAVAFILVGHPADGPPPENTVKVPLIQDSCALLECFIIKLRGDFATLDPGLEF